MEKASSPSRLASRKLLSFFVVIFVFLNLASTPAWFPLPQGESTSTVEPSITFTNSATEAPIITETSTAFFSETPTLTIPSETVTPTVSPSSISDKDLNGSFVLDEVLVRFHKNAKKEAIDQCFQSTNTEIKTEIKELTVFLLNVPAGRIAETITRLLTCPKVLYAEPNYLAETTDTIPSDQNWSLQYGLMNIRAPQGWDFTTGSSSVTIAVLDTGVDLSHSDLAGKIVGGYDFVNNDTMPNDDNGHGTHVAGIAAAISNNGIGVAGVSWGARIMPIKVLNSGGGGTFSNVAAGIVWATDNGAQVINLSLGGSSPSTVLQDAVNYAYNRGVVLVAAAGNTGANFVLYPARYSNVIAVSATDSTNARAGFSNFGPEIDIAAPGASIYSTTVGGYGYLSGTSMSASFVSGLAAILCGIPGNCSPDAIAWQMESTALDLGISGVDDYFGYGLIQMDAALNAVLRVTTQTSTITSISPPISTPTFTAAPISTPGGQPSLISTIGSNPSVTSISSYPSAELVTVSPTLVSTATSPMGITEGPEVIALETTSPGLAKKGQNLILPCVGTFLIFVGILLFWLASSNSRNYRRTKRFK